jgi:Cft2 family RNA processing exonuclease
MRLVCLGGAGEIGANSYFVAPTPRGPALLLDAGIHPKREGRPALPLLDALPEEPEHILVTHAHLDHVGALPVVARRFPHARIHMTEATARFALRMLRNSAQVLRRRHEQGGPEPLYGFPAVEDLEHVVEEHAEESVVQLGRGVRARFVPAGHIPGAAGVLLEAAGRTLFYTGDTCGASQLLIPGARYPEGPVDALLTETTYGGNLVADAVRKDEVVRRFAQAIRDVVDGGGRVLLPVFALGRAQELLFLLSLLRDKGRIPRVPLYLTGLARAVTHLYDETRHLTRRHDPSLRLERLDFRMLDDEILAAGGPEPPSIVLASSGMLIPQTLSNRLAATVLPEARDAIFIVGYQDPDSPGFRVQHSVEGAEIDLGDGRPPVLRRCAVERFHFRAHSSRAELLSAARRMKPRLAVLIHGDPSSSASIGATLDEAGGNTLRPEPGLPYDL